MHIEVWSKMADLKNITWDDLRKYFDFVKEVFEQPEALKSLLDHYSSDDGKQELAGLKQDWNENQFRQVVFSGMGSSLFAGHIAVHALRSHGIPCTLIDSGELLYHGFVDQARSTLFILTSQSGESIEIVKLLEKIPAGDTGNVVWGISNSEGSTLAKKAVKCLFLKAGTEKSVTSKTFCNTLVLMHLFSRIISVKNLDAVERAIESTITNIQELIAAIERSLGTKKQLGDKMVQFVGENAHAMEIVARGTSLASAEQMGLNIKEMNKIPAEALSAGQFRHGPIEMIDKNFRAIILISDDRSRSLNEDLAWNITHRWGGGKAIVITNQISRKLDGEPRVMQIVHDVKDPFLAPVMEIIIVQLFMIKLATANEVEPGVFRYSSKITKEG